MTLLESLLDAIVRLEGDALVMHVGEKPYVVTTSSSMNAYRGPLAWGQVELSSRILTSEAVLSMVSQILPTDERQTLDDLGAVEHEVSAPHGVVDRFTVVAARGGDDIWLELRRHAAPAAEPAVEQPAAMGAAETDSEAVAIGLEEPPRGAEPLVSDYYRQEGLEIPESQAAGAPSQDQRDDATIEETTIEETTIEERVAVLDEVGRGHTGHIEHIRIPVNGEDASEPEDTAVELVDPEPQHVPTDEDVDAMLAATAGALLTNSVDLPEGDHVDADAPTELIVIDESEGDVFERDPDGAFAAAGDEHPGIDLSSALDDMPASTWSPEPQYPAPESQIAAPELAPQPQAPGEEERVASPALEESVAAGSAGGESAAEEPPVPRQAPVQPAAPPVVPAAAAFSHVHAETAADREAAGDSDRHSIKPPEIPVDHSALPSSRSDNASGPREPLEGSRRNAPAGERVASGGGAPLAQDQEQRSPAYAEAAAGAHEGSAGVVVPLSRAGTRPDKPTPGGRVDDETLLQMLRVAADRGASTVYVVAQSRPMIRVDGEISALEAEPTLSASDIERLIQALAPRRPDGPADGPVEWISEVPEVGRVRCVTFRDHRGPGLIFRMVSARSISADHLNLAPEIRDLCAQADGFVLVTGARGSGKSTLLNSFVDLINRTRSDHVITIESEIGFVHESRRSFVSQREFHNNPAGAAAAAHSALKEDPDVLVIEDLHSPESISAALEAAESGRLVFASITASSSSAAIDAMVEMFPAGQHAAIRAALSRSLRAVVSQVLLRKAAGGRVTARELLLNSPAVAAAIRDGRSSDVAAALEAGQRHGMVSMNEALATMVRAGTVQAGEAYRRAPDRAALLGCLAREGLDTAFAERLA